MLSRGQALVLALACLGGVLLIAWAAVSGPVRVPESTGPPPSYVAPAPTAATQSASASPTATPTPGSQRPPGRGPNLSWIRYLVIGTVVAGALMLLVRSLPRLARIWRELPDTDPTGHGDLGLLPGRTDELAQAIADDRSRQLAAVDEGGPRNGIVAAWSRLEEITADSGLPRKGWETAAEFTVRMLKSLDLDPLAAAELAELYRLARFSSHDLDEGQRDRARAALGRLHDDVRQLR
jgi:Domain of unknown function (DUF4129)